MKYVVLYESADDAATKAPPQFLAHKAWYEGFHPRRLADDRRLRRPAAQRLDGGVPNM